MARLGLDKNRKFLRLARDLNAVSGGMGEVMARGILETLWDACYERADDHLGDAADVEIAARWRATSGQLVDLLLAAGGQGSAGFIESDPDRGGYRVHDFWTHAPAWVKAKADKAAAREAAGQTLSEVRSAAGRAGRAKQLERASTGQTAERLPAQEGQPPGKDRAKSHNVDGTGRDVEGSGSSAPATPVAGISGDLFHAQRDKPPAESKPKAPTLREIAGYTLDEALATLKAGGGVATEPLGDLAPRVTNALKAQHPFPLSEMLRMSQWIAACVQAGYGAGGFKGTVPTLSDMLRRGALTGWRQGAAAWDGNPIGAGRVNGNAARPRVIGAAEPAAVVVKGDQL